MKAQKPIFKVILDERRIKSDNTYPLKLRLTLGKSRKYYNIGIDLTKEDFEKIPTSKREKLKDIKIQIQALEVKAANITKTLDPFEVSNFEKVFFKKPKIVKSSEVYEMMNEYIEKLNSENRVSTAQSYLCSLNSLKSFKPKLKFEQITPDFLNRYEQFMMSNGKSSTTVGIYLRSLRAIFNQAIETGLAKRELYPFKKSKFQIPAGRNIKKALDKADVKKIIEFPTISGTPMDKAKDFWIFSYLCNGLNLKDICRLKYQDIKGNKISVVRAKTQRSSKGNQRTIEIMLTSYTQNIIDKWGQKPIVASKFVFPFLNDAKTAIRERELIQYLTKLVNKYMKKIGTELGIEKEITSYTARHTFSTVLKRSGAPIEFISESLGHSNLQTTEAYLDSFEDDAKLKYTNSLTDFL